MGASESGILGGRDRKKIKPGHFWLPGCLCCWLGVHDRVVVASENHRDPEYKRHQRQYAPAAMYGVRVAVMLGCSVGFFTMRPIFEVSHSAALSMPKTIPS